MADAVRFGIIGTGMGRDRAHKAANTPGAQLVAVCSLDEDAGRKIADRYGCEFIPDYDAMLARQDIDAIGVMVPSGWHCDFAIRALEAGKHAFTTKPMDIRLAKCDAAIAAAKRSGKVFAVDFDCRYDPTNHRIRQAVRSGKLGKLFLADLRMKWYREQSYYDGGMPAGWRSRLETEGGSAANQGIHYLDLLIWWLGPVRSVQARIATVSHRIETEDNMNALLTFESGAWGILQTSTSNYPDLGTSVELSGDQGTLAWKDGKITLFRTKEEEAPSLDAYPVDPDLPANIIADMVAAITTGRRPMCPPEEGRRSVALLDAIYRSAKTGETVRIAG